ncbi:GNAT family N-acetyltransferase [Saccharothrix xinjiangensis]|uniref:GNAT family N-acetyltransferase n=1 Tax=Saccharothrix xinjiangensis TaxID=204798 RepID=A0ABV9Y8W4_9PSEU
MTDAAPLTTDTDLVRRWLRGWVECRGWGPVEEVRDGLSLLPRQEGRHREVVALHDGPDALAALAAEVPGGAGPTWLTVPTTRPDEVERALREAGLTVRGTRERLMTRDLRAHPVRGAAAPYRCDTEVDGPVVRVRVRHESGDLAASGAVSVLGGDAVADRVETAVDHRRRGLGSVVMGVLATEAVARGATTGLLVASPEGERLYSALGWSAGPAVVIASA